jgi:hypothetical protein
MYFYGLFFSNNALYLRIPSTNVESVSSIHLNSTSVEVLRSLPHLRVVNTVYSYQKRVDRVKSKKKSNDDQNGIGMEKNNENETSEAVKPMKNDTDIQSPQINTKKAPKLSVTQPLLLFLIYTMLCRLLLAVLIYRNSNRSFEMDVDELGQVRQRRILNPRSFWEIFRTIPLRTRSGSRFQQSRQARFLAFATRLNQQRVANGARPLNLQSLALLFSNRDFNALDYESLWDFQERNGQGLVNNMQSHGASDEEINRCPLRTLVVGDDLVTGRFNHQQTNHILEERTSCAICLENYLVDDKIRTLPCFHHMHQICVDRWLRQKANCPICKHNII